MLKHAHALPHCGFSGDDSNDSTEVLSCSCFQEPSLLLVLECKKNMGSDGGIEDTVGMRGVVTGLLKR